jgi:hypothetical protein
MAEISCVSGLKELSVISRALPQPNHPAQPRRPRLRAVQAAAGLLLVGLLATGCTGGGSDTTFSACLNGSGGLSNVKVGKDAATCTGGAVPVAWGAGTQAGVPGAAGANGAAGAAGAKGATGATGKPGPTGAAGPSGTTGAAGVAGAKGDTGADGAAGAKGDTGATGAAGAKGDTGATGATGKNGTVGADGATGATGAQGAKGDTGSAGAAGANGTTGAAGQDGATGPAGATGAQGAKGDTGATGAAGQDGATGATGAVGATGAQGIAGSNGNSVLSGTGTPANTAGADGDFYLDLASYTMYGPKASGDWPAATQSLIGPTGPIGPQGIQGIQGLQGVIGATGNTGSTGLQGSTGTTGPAGATGATGPAGPQGPAGTDGSSDILVGGAKFIDPLDATGYLPPSAFTSVTSAQGDAAVAMPRAGQLSGLMVNMTQAPATDVTLTVVVAGLPTAISCKVVAASTACTDTSHTVALTSGQTVSVQVTKSASSAVTNLRFAINFGGN